MKNNALKKTLKSIFEDAGYEPQAYSGRGMFGAQCLGVDVKDYGTFFADIMELPLDLDSRKTLATAFRKMSYESLGKDMILYFPGVPFSG